MKPINIEAFEIDASNGVDPIQVFWQDVAVGKGAVTINCYGCAWTVYFGAMGTDTIRSFFADVDVGYLVTKMGNNHPLKQTKQADKYLARIIANIQQSLKVVA